MAEFNLINQIINTQSLSRPDVKTGIGDDCAILKIPENKSLAVSMDTLVKGVHFPAETSAYSIGYKSLAVNLSDLAATGAEPAWATLSLTMPNENRGWLEDFMRGFFDLANEHNVQLIGGDTTQGELAITVQVHGFVHKPLLRSAANIGDKIFVSGGLGESALGFHTFIASDIDDSPAISRFKRPEPRVKLGQCLTEIATSCIDISDGLVSDLAHICDSSGVGAEIHLKLIPLSGQVKEYFSEESLYQQALGFGDDYELCFTVPPSQGKVISQLSKDLGIALSYIGTITDYSGVKYLDKNNNEVYLKKGYEHFNG